MIQLLGHEGFLDSCMPKGWRSRARVNPTPEVYNQGEQPIRGYARDEGRLNLLAEGVSSSPQHPRLELIA